MSSAVATVTTSTMSTCEACSHNSPAGNDGYFLYQWEIYRATSQEPDGGVIKTCTVQYMTGSCKWVKPNCVIGTCLNQHCIECIPGAPQFRSLGDIGSEWPACLDDIGVDVPQCDAFNNDGDCCTSASPCGEWQGDCDSNSDCQGNLVCNESFCSENPGFCQESWFDICTKPSLLTAEASVGASDFTREDAEVGGVTFEETETEAEFQAEPASGCAQFDDEGHCTAGPLYKYCTWKLEHCVMKEGVSQVPDGDYTYVYDRQDSLRQTKPVIKNKVRAAKNAEKKASDRQDSLRQTKPVTKNEVRAAKNAEKNASEADETIKSTVDETNNGIANLAASAQVALANTNLPIKLMAIVGGLSIAYGIYSFTVLKKEYTWVNDIEV